MVNQVGTLVFTYCCVAPDFKNGADTSVRLKQEKLPPLLPTDLNIAILVHSGIGREGGEEGGKGEKEKERKRERMRGRDKFFNSITAVNSTQYNTISDNNKAEFI